MADPTNLSSPEDCVALYEDGFDGAYDDPAADDALDDTLAATGCPRSAEAAITAGGYRGSGEGVLSLPYLAALRMYPQVLPGGSQARGDCVSWTVRSAAVVSYCAELWYGANADRYAPPEVSPAGRLDGLFATESWYWFRGHSGEGWNCADATRVALTKAGMLVRRNYPEIGINLERYSGATAGKWGARQPPDEVIAVTSKNLLGSATVCKTWAEVRDMLANGYAIVTCGSEAFSHRRDEYGLCQRSREIWRHAMSYIATDDRPEMRSHYKCRTGGLVLVQNSWGNYCGDEYPIHQSTSRIPAGSFWARWDDVANRSMIAIGGGRGFTAKPIPRSSLERIV